MNNLFAAKLLQNLRNKKGNKGFTLIELLVVVIIIGVLAAVALPNLLGQVGKARETEAKNGVGTINRAQQAYHFEKRAFGPDLNNSALGGQNALGVILASDYFDFVTTTNAGEEWAKVEADPNEGTLDSQDNGVRAYAAGISHDAGAYDTVVCQANVVDNSDDATGLMTTAANSVTCDTANASELK